jgi:hypothetical protein
MTARSSVFAIDSAFHRLIFVLVSRGSRTAYWRCRENRSIYAVRCHAVRSLRSALQDGNRGKRALFAHFGESKGDNSLQSKLRGGGRGIRTPGTVSRTSVFKTDCFNHSHIPPRRGGLLLLRLVYNIRPTVRILTSGRMLANEMP